MTSSIEKVQTIILGRKIANGSTRAENPADLTQVEAKTCQTGVYKAAEQYLFRSRNIRTTRNLDTQFQSSFTIGELVP